MASLVDRAEKGDDDSGISSGGSFNSGSETVVCITVPQFDIRKYFQFSQADGVWTLKQAVIAGIGVELNESFNWGLYCPPVDGKAGKFLDEGRCMSDYSLQGSVGHLEFKYKSRVYKHLQQRPRNIVKANHKENLKKLMVAVTKGDVKKIQKLTDDGADPNFIDAELAETPLTLAAVALANPEPVMQALVGGGAHLDFRNTQALTALHRAAQCCNMAAIKALLALGSSANYQDPNGLTPLYYTIFSTDSEKSPPCVELLLYNHAAVDVVDDKGWTPLHQVCKSGKIKLMDQLIYYGADVNAQNSNGNTPLHIAAINNQEECARILLFRGANKHIVNQSKADPHKIAVLSQCQKIADMIQNYRENDVVPIRERPKFNPKVRPQTLQMGTLCRGSVSACELVPHSKKPGADRSLSSDLFKSPSQNSPTTEQHPTATTQGRGQITRANTLPANTGNRQMSLVNTTKQQTQQHQLQQQLSTHVPAIQGVQGEGDVYSNLNFPPPPSSFGLSVTSQPVDEKEEYENIEECMQRVQLKKTANKNTAAGTGNKNCRVSTVLGQFDNIFGGESSPQEPRKPMPPPAWMKPKPDPELTAAASDDGGGARTTAGSWGGDGSAATFTTIAENARRLLMQRRLSTTDSESSDHSQQQQATDQSSTTTTFPSVSQQSMNRPSFPKIGSAPTIAQNPPQSSAGDDLKRMLAHRAANRQIDESKFLADSSSTNCSAAASSSSTFNPRGMPRPNAAADVDQQSPNGTMRTKGGPPPPVKQKSLKQPSTDLPTEGHFPPPPTEWDQPVQQRRVFGITKQSVVDDGSASFFLPPPPEEFTSRPSTAKKYNVSAQSTLPPPPAQSFSIAPRLDEKWMKRQLPKFNLPTASSEAATMPPPPTEFSTFSAGKKQPEVSSFPAPPPPISFQNSNPDSGWATRKEMPKFSSTQSTPSFSSSIVSDVDLPPPPPDFSDFGGFSVSSLPPPPAAFDRPTTVSRPVVGGASKLSSGSNSMSDWTPEEVIRWLDGLSMPEYRAAFAAARVDGRRLVSMDGDDLFRLGVKQQGHLMLLQRAIKIGAQS